MKTKIIFKQENLSVEVETGTSLLRAAHLAGVELEADCKGAGRCGKCRVIASGGLSPLTPRERDLLTPREVREGMRLACRTFVTGPAVVTSIPRSAGRDSILEEGVSRKVALRPAVAKHLIRLDGSGFRGSRTTVEEGISRLLRRHRLRRAPGDFHCLRSVPAVLRSSAGELTVLASDKEILGFEEGNTTERNYGVAVDIGTTTVVAYLYDLHSGAFVGVDSSLNGQRSFGADVVSRIDHALEDSTGLQHLQQAIIQTIDALIEKLCASYGLSGEDIYTVVLVGNTPMHHFFWGIFPTFLTRFPYNPLTTKTLSIPARDTGLRINPFGRVISLPLISGFVGSDTVAVVLSTGLDRSRVPRLAIDIGTNGEIVLTDGSSMIAASCAAGPAFEGAHIQCGMRGASGAIDRVYLRGRTLHYHVIDDVPPRGICGSGLVDAVAILRGQGLISSDGRLAVPQGFANRALADRLSRQKHVQFFITDPRKTGLPQQVAITQRDIRELQLAKGAIMAGIQILLDRLKLKEHDIREVYLAGGFGNYISPDGAVAIGLIPAFSRAKITQVGNAAGGGARMALLSNPDLEHAVRIAEQIEYVELAKHPDFQKNFVKGMAFP
ncbi:MAG: DUF4445 domain-containing protein [Spirochaetales bacterium]|nr:DUF4445 domain-containing protein [Spirochaetales bacterium]